MRILISLILSWNVLIATGNLQQDEINRFIESYSHKNRETLLEITDAEEIVDIRFLKDFSNLTHLDISGDCSIGDHYYPIADLVSLKKLYLTGVSFYSLNPIVPLTSLTVLNISDNPVTSIASLTNLSKLKILDISYCTHIRDLECIGQITSLNILSMHHVYIQEEISYTPLEDYMASLVKLHELDISSNRLLDSIDVLCRLPRLGILNVAKCMHIRDYRCLANIRSLKRVTMPRDWDLPHGAMIPQFSSAVSVYYPPYPRSQNFSNGTAIVHTRGRRADTNAQGEVGYYGKHSWAMEMQDVRCRKLRTLGTEYRKIKESI